MDDASEFVAVKFPYNETCKYFFGKLGFAKWDAAAKVYVMPRADWETLLSDENNLPKQIRDVTRDDWKETLAATEVLRAATVEPRDAMPKYIFVGGRSRFRQTA